MNILIVEDNEKSLYLLNHFLSGKGHQVLKALNGRQALDLCEGGASPDLIISDALMPLMDGFELCYTLRRDTRFCNTPFVLYTATYVAENDERFALSLGVDRFIIKPQEPDLLYASLMQLMEERSRALPRACTGGDPKQNLVENHLRTVSIKLEEKLRELAASNTQLSQAQRTERELNARLQATVSRLENEVVERRRSEELLRLALQVGDIVTWESTQPSGQLLFSREARTSLLLPEDPDSAFRTFLDNTVPEHRQVLQDFLSPSCLPGRQAAGVEFFYRTPQAKETRVLEIKCRQLPDEKNGPGGLIGTLRDLTARHSAEEQRRNLETQLLRSQKMEALGNLAGGIAHDFNNILTAIFGHAELIRMDLAQHLPGSESRASIEEIIHAAERSRDTIRQILTFSRRETVEHKVLDFDQSIENCLRLIRSTLPRNIALNTDLHSNRWALLSEIQLQQVLLNLCTNASHAVPPQGGRIEVSTKAVELTKGGPLSRRDGRLGPHILLQVRDNGCGMSTEVLNRLFEPFFTTKPQGQGTGLGLAVVHGILQAHEASVSVESQPGEGTCFRILFPVTAQGTQSLSPDANKDPLSTKPPRHILIVDDEPSVSHGCVRLLGRLGYRVTAINEANEARALFLRSPEVFDAAIVDHLMPRLTGLDLIKAMHQVRPEFPVIIAAGFGSQVDIQELEKEGIHGVINKPYSLNALSESLTLLFPSS